MSDIPESFHMDLEEFRSNGYKAIDWVVDYLKNVESYPVLSQVAPNEIRSRLPSGPPDEGEGFDAMLRDVTEIVLPGITHWQSPNFFAYFPCNSSPPAILGEILSAGLGVQGMLWATSPACTEVETQMMDWLVQMLGLPEKFSSATDGGGVIQHSASDATLCALLAAREQVTEGRSNKLGCDGRLVAYTSAQAHSSIEKACMIAGIGSDNLRLIEVDEAFALRPDALQRQVRIDKERGLLPFFVCTCVGTTSSLALDPVADIAKVAKEHDLWVHVDAAMAGTAAICPELRFINDGVEDADSYTFNPHKWMLTNFDCDCFYVADRASLVGALGIMPDYLKNKATTSGKVIDYRDWHIPLGRRFRALKLWFVIRSYGVEGLQRHVRHTVQLAQDFAEWVEQDPRFELLLPPPLNLVCFRLRGTDEMNQALLERLNHSGKLYVTQTRLDGRYVLRFCVGVAQTEAQHVHQAWAHIQAEAARLVSSC